MSHQALVQIPVDELPRLREAMRDVQRSVAAFYAETARDIDELGMRVRTFLAAAQVVNDLLTSASAAQSTYKTLFTPPASLPVDLIQGVKYVRNVDQHVFHIVRPSDDSILIGGLHGLRSYVVWDEIPRAAHDQLRPGTRALKSSYDTALLGKDVTATMMGVLRFYWAVDPAMVHRDARGEWTGFPLMSQPGVSGPLHPEEPSDAAAALAWLNSRQPNGDRRVVCAQVTFEGPRYVCGFTFEGRHSFAPFAETSEQVERDVSSGFSYVVGAATANLEDVTQLLPQARQGAVLFSANEFDEWTSTFANTATGDWCSWGDPDDWQRVVRVENTLGVPLQVRYELRRARRLNALVPPRS